MTWVDRDQGELLEARCDCGRRVYRAVRSSARELRCSGCGEEFLVCMCPPVPIAPEAIP